MKFELPKLPYAYDALEPYLDSMTMELHHSKHHQAYVDKLNTALEKHPDLMDMSVEDLLKNLDSLKVDEASRTAIRNHGGGHANHSFFWQILGPVSPAASQGGPKKEIDEQMAADITAAFGSVDDFKKQFTDTAVKHFGSGWAWLVRDENAQLRVYSTSNQDSPLTLGHIPLITLDLWEHAYYLKYQNRRPEYIDNWWQVLKII